MPLDLHNVYLFAMLAIPLIVIRMTSDHGPWFGLLCSVVIFIALAGRVLAHGTDLRRRGPDRWKTYVFTNIAFNILCTISVFGLFWVN